MQQKTLIIFATRIMERKVRVRFAPSPTGALHIGGVRTALYNYLFAKKHSGDFLLRIEDTDQTRFVPGAEQYIIEALKWLKIEAVEGVGFGDGPHAPYRQSERKPMYKQYVMHLIEGGYAYYAFDTAEELDGMRERLKASNVDAKYDAITRGTMKNSLTLPEDEVKRRLEAGDAYVVFADESEAKTLANKRLQLVREQGIRTKRHITLDEIGRRLAVGNFKELKLIVKGDVDGSVEALADSLMKLTTEEIAVTVIHSGVGQITESDVLLASASDAIIVGFQVRPSAKAKQIAENEEIDIRTYAVIYQAIDEIKQAMEGMLSPDVVEKIIGNVEIREVFKISKVGTIAGCYVTSGVIERKAKLRVIRDGVVIHTGELNSLKRFKDDVKEVTKGYECGLQVERFNDIEVGDYLEIFKTEEVKRKL